MTSSIFVRLSPDSHISLIGKTDSIQPVTASHEWKRVGDDAEYVGETAKISLGLTESVPAGKPFEMWVRHDEPQANLGWYFPSCESQDGIAISASHVAVPAGRMLYSHDPIHFADLPA